MRNVLLGRGGAHCFGNFHFKNMAQDDRLRASGFIPHPSFLIPEELHALPGLYFFGVFGELEGFQHFLDFAVHKRI